MTFLKSISTNPLCFNGSSLRAKSTSGTKSIWLLGLLFALLLSGCVAEYRAEHATQHSTDSSTTPLAVNVQRVRAQLANEQTIMPPAQPARLQIPAIGVDAQIEAVGRGDDDGMGLPSGWETTAWYALGSRPGQMGNSVIAGHFNTPRDRPAVFWNLGKLTPGDEVLVEESDGTRHIFQVTTVASYPFDDAPLAHIFGFNPYVRALNLITCAGEWNRSDRNYSQRLVVKTLLVETITPPSNLQAHSALR